MSAFKITPLASSIIVHSLPLAIHVGLKGVQHQVALTGITEFRFDPGKSIEWTYEDDYNGARVAHIDPEQVAVINYTNGEVTSE